MPENLRERSRFRTLIAANPNYFGNLKTDLFKPVLQIQSNTEYESIGCVGYHPDLRRLDAVIYTHQSGGYSGGICTNGSREYVRFYLSYDNGATWEDEGVSSVVVRDISEQATQGKRLEYAVSKIVTPKRKFCFQNNVILARAILSWNVAPPPNTPDYVPVWGETHNTHIQVDPRKFIILKPLFEELQIKIPDILPEVLDLEAPIPSAKKALSAPQLQKLYANQDVEPKRFAFKEALMIADGAGAPGEEIQKADFAGILKAGPLAGVKLNIEDILGILNPGDGNTSYEELDCVGYHPQKSELSAVLRIKRPFGYSGSPCTQGSYEYVAFWADTDGNGSFETYIGTAAVNVHDIAEPQKGDLEYSVSLPFDAEQYRIPCRKGARVIPIRAILSWNNPPPPNNPNFVPVWGNREETQILIEPGQGIGQNEQAPLLSAVGDMAVSIISAAGKATGTGNTTGFSASDSPFGGRINIAGKIAGGTPFSRYRVMRKPAGAPDSAYTPIVNNPLRLTLVTFSGGILTVNNNFLVTPDANGYYAYQDYSSSHYVESNLLVRWYTGEEEDGKLFDVRVDLSTDGNPANDKHSAPTRVLVDNTRPDVSLTLDLGVDGECADFTKGETFTGTFSATDAHFYNYNFEVRPSGPANGAAPVPVPLSNLSVFYGGAITDPGVAAGTYSFDTTPMKPCGYSLTIRARSRTNVNSGTARHQRETSVGFCVREG